MERPTPMYDVTTQRRALVDGLVEAHQSTLAAHMQQSLATGVIAACRYLGWMGLIYFAWRLLCTIARIDPILDGWWIVAVALAAAIGTVIIHVFAERKEDHALTETAERLDLAAGTKNRIATALDLSSRRVGPYEFAAIEDGVAALENTREVEPARDEPRPVAVGSFSFGYAGLILLVLALYLPFASTPGAEITVPEGASRVRQEASKPGAADTEEADRPETPPKSRIERADQPLAKKPQVKRPAASQQKSATKSTGRRQEASGRPGRGKSGEAREARQASRSRGEPTEGETPKGSPAPRRPKKKKSAKKKKKPTESRMLAKKKKEGEQTGATVGQGGSGGGAMSPVKSPWTQRDRSDDEPLPENPAEEDVDDEIEEEEARGGTQPSLRDRRSATARDLSISGPGEGGDGRGGPTPHKKSRGTASLVMGIPVPDFVRGLLNPGTTKVTHERVEPVTSPAAPRAPVDVLARNRREPLVERTRFRPELKTTIQRFLRAVHDAASPMAKKAAVKKAAAKKTPAKQ